MKIIVALLLLGLVNALEEGRAQVPLVSYEIFVPEIQVYDVVSSLFSQPDQQKFKPKVDRQYYLTHRSPPITFQTPHQNNPTSNPYTIPQLTKTPLNPIQKRSHQKPQTDYFYIYSGVLLLIILIFIVSKSKKNEHSRLQVQPSEEEDDYEGSGLKINVRR